MERRRSTSSHKELLHLRGLVHEAVRLVMPRPKVASSGEEEKDGEQNRKRTTKLSRFPSATWPNGTISVGVYEERLYNGRLDRPLIQPASCSRAMEILCFKFSFIGVSLIARVQF